MSREHPRPRSLQRARADEILADGLWRDYEWVRRQIAQVIQPGQALRRVEIMRQASVRFRRKRGEGLGETGERRHKPSREFLIEAGRRRIALETLNSGSFEIMRDDKGKKWVRLRPGLVEKDSPPSTSTETRSTPSSPCSQDRASA